MEKEYDFSKAEQGKFYRPIEELDIPRELQCSGFPFFWLKNGTRRECNFDYYLLICRVSGFVSLRV